MLHGFSTQNLRGCSFKSQNLTGADFSYADIRGANFTNANLRGANFAYAKAGLQRHWVIILVIVSLLLAVLSGLISALAGAWISVFFSPNFTNQYGFLPGAIILFVYVVFFLLTIRQGVGAGAVVGASIIVAILAGAVVVLPAMAGAAAPAVAAVVAVAVAAVVVAAATTVIAEAVVVPAVVVVPAAVAVAVAAVMTRVMGVSAAVIVPAIVTVLGIYLAWRALVEDQKHTFIRTLTIAFAAIGGTSFCRADLTDANFTHATLKSTDFRGAILTWTRWYQAKKLDHACVGMTYLKKPQVRQLVVTGQGQDKSFDRQNLQGVNLQRANLVDASFISTDLSEANLQDADLSRARLVQTQLDKTDFTGATLTGAYIENWGITNETKFDGVRCEYIYMQLPTAKNPDPLRKPDNREEVFADGEFGDFIKPIVDTLDLYHNHGVDPRAISIAFKQLAENHPDAELEIVGMEKRGEDKFLLRAKTALEADKSELSAEYFATYNQLKSLAEREIKLLLAEKEIQIRRLENMVMTALERPSFYSNTQVEKVGSMTGVSGEISEEIIGLQQEQKAESQDYVNQYFQLNR